MGKRSIIIIFLWHALFDLGCGYCLFSFMHCTHITACPSFSPSPITLSHKALGQGVNEVSSLPIITVHPVSADVAQGGSVDLSCGATNANLPVLFTHNGVVIDGSDPNRRNMSNNLNIMNFGAGFEGEYVCLARNRVGDTIFTVASAPAFIRLKGEQTQ